MKDASELQILTVFSTLALATGDHGPGGDNAMKTLHDGLRFDPYLYDIRPEPGIVPPVHQNLIYGMA